MNLLPETMKAIEFDGAGGPEVLKLVSRRVGEAGDNQVLIEVFAAGVNRPDCLQREGKYPPPEGAVDIPGLEVSGEIVSCGANVTRFKTGDRVMALVTGGGYGQYVVADEGCVLSVPHGLSMVEAACVPETFFTVWHNVFQRGRLVKGETLLVHGGTSGIGTTAIQLGKQFGANVFATAGSAEKCASCLSLGAKGAINYREEDFVSRIGEMTNGAGADVILDMVGGDYTSRNYAAAAVEGRIVQIAFLGGSKTQVDFMTLMLKRLTHTGSTLRAREVGFKKQIGRELEEKVWPLIEAGKIRPVIDATFALEDAVNAHRRIEDRGHIGKIVLKMKS